MLSVIDEQNNAGLDEGYDGLEAAYAGEVEGSHLDDSGRARRIQERLTAAEPAAAILTLNASVQAGTVRAVDVVDQRPVIATVGIEFSLLGSHLPVAREVVRCMVDPTSAIQGVWTAMALYRATDAVANTPDPSTSLLKATTMAELRPRVVDTATVLSKPKLLRRLAENARRS